LTIQIKNQEHYHDAKKCPRNCTKQGVNHIKIVEEEVRKHGRLFDVRFKQLRVTVKLEKTALAIVEEQKLAKFLFPSVSSYGPTRFSRFETVVLKNQKTNFF
jgi:hypothetical protein